MIKGRMQQEDITITSICMYKHSPMLTQIKGGIHNNAKTVGGFSTQTSAMNRSLGQVTHKDMLDLKYSLHQVDPNTDRNIPPSRRFHVFLKCTQNILWKRTYVRLQKNPE